jgi:hypothetical protein
VDEILAVVHSMILPLSLFVSDMFNKKVITKEKR